MLNMTLLAGIGLTLILASLAADMFYEIDFLVEMNPEVFGKVGVYAQAYSLLCCAMGLGTALGPILAGVLLEKAGWQITHSVLAIICAAGSIGVYQYTGRVRFGTKRVRFTELADVA